MLAPGTRRMQLYRGLLWARVTGMNAGRWVYNTLVAPVAGDRRLEYKEVKLPLNTEKIVELLFRCACGGGAGGRGEESFVTT